MSGIRSRADVTRSDTDSELSAAYYCPTSGLVIAYVMLESWLWLDWNSMQEASIGYLHLAESINENYSSKPLILACTME